ncbi:MAG: hypothetical protein J5965_25245 [Aeriscardovia sp.]|nr:hypothetical protein [Aeriscardovia sp.]
MRKKIIIMLLSGLLCQNIYAGGNDVHFYLSIIDISMEGPGNTKSPIRPLTAMLDDHTLTFYSSFGDMVTVTLLDENENVVYTDWLVPGQTSLVFPDTLSGEYTICLTIGSIHYIGVIEL